MITKGRALGFLLCLLALAGPAMAQAIWQPFSAMAFEGGYRLTAVQRGDKLDIAWRPYDHSLLLAQTSLDVRSEDGLLEAIPGSAERLANLESVIFVVLDTRDADVLFDQLVSLRSALANARFAQQRWEVFKTSALTEPVAIVRQEADLATEWPKLRALLSQPNEDLGGEVGALSPLLAQLAQRTGDRKALVFPQTLATALSPGLTDQGIAALQAFGISLFPLTYQLDQPAMDAFALLAGSTGGRVLPWLDIPPGSQEAALSFLPLSAGATATFVMPPPPWQPWKDAAPLVATLSADGSGILSIIIPRPPSSWSQVPWVVILELVAVLLIGAVYSGFFARKASSAPVNAELVELATGRRHVIRRWPSTVGRSEGADVTIANANLAPIHLTLKAVSGAVQMRLEDEKTDDLEVSGQRVVETLATVSTPFTLAGLGFRLDLMNDA